jgi:hypothetical protein
MYPNPYPKTEKQKREPIPIRIVQTEETPESEHSFQTKRQCKRIIAPVSVFKKEKAQSESETDVSDASPIHSKYIHSVLRRKASHYPTFGVYQDYTDGYYKIRQPNSEYNKKYVSVGDKKYKATQGLWELVTKSRPDMNMVTLQDRQAYKQIIMLSNLHRVNYSPTGRIRANEGIVYAVYFSTVYEHTRTCNKYQWCLGNGSCRFELHLKI